MVGPDASIKLDSTGGIEVVAQDETITVHHDRSENVANNETITIHGGRTETVDNNETITVGGDRSEKISGNGTVKVSGGHTIQAGAGLELSGATVGINRSAACKSVARVTDLINPSDNTIITGSPTVCID
jgi:type VI secretion system secreted protein VgrG